jgi:hypothetical protein
VVALPLYQNPFCNYRRKSFSYLENIDPTSNPPLLMGDLTLRGLLKLGYSAKIIKIFYKKQKCFVFM